MVIWWESWFMWLHKEISISMGRWPSPNSGVFHPSFWPWHTWFNPVLVRRMSPQGISFPDGTFARGGRSAFRKKPCQWFLGWVVAYTFVWSGMWLSGFGMVWLGKTESIPMYGGWGMPLSQNRHRPCPVIKWWEFWQRLERVAASIKITCFRVVLLALM